MTIYILMMVVHLYGHNNTDAVWVAAPVLGNPYNKISDCGRAQARMETASGGVGKYKCVARHRDKVATP